MSDFYQTFRVHLTVFVFKNKFDLMHFLAPIVTESPEPKKQKLLGVKKRTKEAVLQH